jgi:thiamine monophosphate synthase
LSQGEDFNKAAELEVGAIGFRARCAAVSCPNLARSIARTVDRHGRPLGQRELCNRHMREAIDEALRIGLGIHDKREPKT